MKDRAIEIETMLRREERQRVAKKADERLIRVLSEISEKKRELAQHHNISVDILNSLLSNPEAWKNFLSSGSAGKAALPVKSNGRIGETTVFETHKWDPHFSLYTKMMNEEA